MYSRVPFPNASSVPLRDSSSVKQKTPLLGFHMQNSVKPKLSIGNISGKVERLVIYVTAGHLHHIIMLELSLIVCIPDIGDDANLADIGDDANHAAWFLNPLVNTDYPEIMKKNAGRRIPT
ncbi:hypothetical protein Tco_1135304 [Tanacetum coccineum]